MRTIENGIGKDAIGIKQPHIVSDRGIEHAVWHIRRYKNAADHKARKVYGDDEAIALFGVKQHSEIIGNMLVNEGINEMNTLIAGTGGVQFNNANAVLIVGTDDTAATATDTRSNFSNPVEKAMDSGFPTYGTNQKITWQATYGSAEANQAWKQFGVLNTITTGELLNHKIEDEGIKVAGQTWELTLEMTLS